MSADDWAMQVLSEQGAQCGDCGAEPGDRDCPDCERCRGRYVKALREAGWAPRGEVLLEAVDRLVADIGPREIPHEAEDVARFVKGYHGAIATLRRMAGEAS